MSRRYLQIVSAVLGTIPVVTGIIGMTGARDPFYASAILQPSPVLDSNLRFFSGVWFGLGVAMYWLIPTIEKQTVLFRALWVMVFIGGIGRLISMLVLAVAPAPLVGFTALELLGAPAMIWWQTQVAVRSGSSASY
jgi:predicted membrane channel-forming protein YqfA (hemolysin III family)